MELYKENQLIRLFEKWANEKAVSIKSLPQSGSYREYYRIEGLQKKAIGVFNPDRKENVAFIGFARHFRTKGLSVPEIFATYDDNLIYLIQDLGDMTLYQYLSLVYKNGIFPRNLIDLYKKVIACLPRFQILAGRDLDYRLCYPRHAFDKRSMMWDLNYFKYYLLKLAKVNFDEQELEDDFQKFSDYLLQTDCDYFLYRDFQSRNIMLVDSEPYFIDFQGGRRGALQYDIASLLYDAKADIPQHIRNQLLEEYIQQVSRHIKVDRKSFTEYYWGYVLIRIMQAMGSYGFRGFYEKKEHFLRSIPYALINLDYILQNVHLPVKLPTLFNVLRRVVDSPQLQSFQKVTTALKVSINSFAYKKGLPPDPTGNGGGFVFDCRAIHNPGRYEKYKPLTGHDQAVIKFLEDQTNINDFLQHVYGLVDTTVENYIERKFTNLMVSFGCTGGQHRSVYCAEQLARHLNSKYDLQIEIHHRELGNG